MQAREGDSLQMGRDRTLPGGSKGGQGADACVGVPQA